MSIASREQPLNRNLPAAVGDENRLPLFGDEPPFAGRPELNHWHPAFDLQLVADLDDFEEGQDELGENNSPPPQGAAWNLLARAPVLDPRHMPLVRSLSAEISEEISGRGRFLTVSPDDIIDAATIYIRYRLPTLDVIRHTALGARRIFLSDLRQLDRRSFPEMQLIMQLLEHFRPQLLKSKANAKDPLFEEVVIPARLRNFRADFSPAGGFSEAQSADGQLCEPRARP